MEKQDDRLLYRVRRAAEMLDTSPSQIYNLVNQGALKAVRLAGSIRIPAEEIRRIAAGGGENA